jgi:hypothetical protein
MALNFSLENLNESLPQSQLEFANQGSFEFPNGKMDLINSSFDKKGSGGEIFDLNNSSSQEFVLFTETKPKETNFEVPAAPRPRRDTIDNAFWLFNDCEFNTWTPKYSSEDLLQDCMLLRKRTSFANIPEFKIAEVNKKPLSSELIEPKKKFKKGVGCSCGKSRCLRLHCKCFNVQGYCGPDCGCVDCLNTPEFEDERSFVINKTKNIFAKAFESKIVKAKNNLALNSQGCRCKTGCQKKYCDCYRNQAGCSPICKCIGCKNTRVEIDPVEVRQHFEPALRSKGRIVIMSPFEDKSKKVYRELEDDSRDTADLDSRIDSRKCVITFRNYRKEKSNSSLTEDSPLCKKLTRPLD